MEDSDWTIRPDTPQTVPTAAGLSSLIGSGPEPSHIYHPHVENVLRTFVSVVSSINTSLHTYIDNQSSDSSQSGLFPHQGGVLPSRLPSEREQPLSETLLSPGQACLRGMELPLP